MSHMITRICLFLQDGSEDVSTLVKGNRNFSQMILWPPAVSCWQEMRKVFRFTDEFPIADARHDCHLNDVCWSESHLCFEVSQLNQKC